MFLNAVPLALLTAGTTLVACADSADTCIDVSSCDGSPVGTWELVDCTDHATLTYTEATVARGTTTTRSCAVTLRSHTLVAGELLVVASNGSYTRDARFSGSWSGLAAASCMADWGVTCAEVVGPLSSFGATACVAGPSGCMCEGAADNAEEDQGEWLTAGGTLTLDGLLASESLSLCADAAAMRLGTGPDARHYRRLAP